MTAHLYRISGPDSLGLDVSGMSARLLSVANGMARVELTCWPGEPRWVRLAQLTPVSGAAETTREWRARLRADAAKRRIVARVAERRAA